MFQLGTMYEHGRGALPPDQSEAVKWYRKAAALGYENAKAALKRLDVKP
jgi:TPR repeat protein